MPDHPDKDGSLEAGDELLFVTAPDFEHQLAEMLAPRDGSIDVARLRRRAFRRSDLAFPAVNPPSVSCPCRASGP